jgi:hypothetical protein
MIIRFALCHCKKIKFGLDFSIEIWFNIRTFLTKEEKEEEE